VITRARNDSAIRPCFLIIAEWLAGWICANFAGLDRPAAQGQRNAVSGAVVFSHRTENGRRRKSDDANGPADAGPAPKQDDRKKKKTAGKKQRSTARSRKGMGAAG
jgi:hypothetical protein